MNQKFTLQEISELSGVSITTVSRVLSNAPNVNSETRAKVLQIIDASALNQIKKKSNIIGFLVPDINNPFFSKLLDGIGSIARIQDYNVVVCHTENEPHREEICIKNLLDANVDGILYISAGDISPNVKKILFEQYPPVVFLDRDPAIENCNLITANSTEGMYQSSKYLLSLGHRDILYLGGNFDLQVNKQRIEGYKKALHEYKLDLDETNVIDGKFSMESSYKQVSKLVSENRFSFTAICSSNDLMAFGAYKALTEAGIKIPEEVSIIGYDDIPTASVINLTTIHQPFEEMGRTAMMELDALIRGGKKTEKHITLGTSLVIRNTCAIPNK